VSGPARLQLKRPNGWFAAGSEVQRAATALSDASFKVFLWLCLHAERASGRLLVTTTALAQPLRKSETEIIQCLEELVQAGVCHRSQDGGLEIQDRFWPYERAPTRQDSNDAAAYVATIQRLFLSHACVRSSFSPPMKNSLAPGTGVASRQKTSSAPSFWEPSASMSRCSTAAQEPRSPRSITSRS
jgi:hypothetical protein